MVCTIFCQLSTAFLLTVLHGQRQENLVEQGESRREEPAIALGSRWNAFEAVYQETANQRDREKAPNLDSAAKYRQSQ
jgi:hypothetical protein